MYLLIVLPLLTRKDEGGVRLYVNRWNEKLDLENAVYRPLGRALNALARLLNRTILHRHPMRTDFEYVLDASFREVSSGIRSMSVSISFGLLLLCIGLYVTCLYLLQ